MRPSQRITSSVLTITALLIVAVTFVQEETLGRSSKLQTKTRQAPAAELTLVCAVTGQGEGEKEMGLDPVVVVNRGRLQAPYAEYNEAAQAKFAGKYFKPGSKYRITFGGGDSGVASITKSDLHATATVETTANIRGQVMGLAISNETLGRKESSRRAPSDDERSQVMEMVKQIYSGRGTSAAVRTMQTVNLTATDLDGDGKLELVGSFIIETKSKARRDLFLIAEPKDSGFKAGLVNFQAYKLPPEGFDSQIKFVDQLDLDGDGVAEVFATQAGFDAYAYLIFKKRNGRWLKVYSAMGDAC
jgi:hypothetical protein